MLPRENERECNTTQEIQIIADYVLKEVCELLPYSSNRPDPKNQPFHRMFWLDVMRASNDSHGTRDKIHKWQMNMQNDQAPTDFADRRVRAIFPGTPLKNPTLDELDEYIFEKIPNRDQKTHHKDGTVVSAYEWLEAKAKNAVQFSIGNCSENAALAFILLAEYPVQGLRGLPAIKENISVFKIGAQGADHAFVVIGMDEKAILTDISTWGPKAIILDPWMGEVVVVADQEMNVESGRYPSDAFDWIFKMQSRLIPLCDTYGFICSGHSPRWIDHRMAKKQSVYIRGSHDFFQQNQQENVPWLTAEVAETSRKKFKKI